MLLPTLTKLFERDLNKLKKEISLYQSEKALWTIDKGISNSGGNLALHLIGNLNTFIGAQFGNTGYVRQRELEFGAKDIPQHKLIQDIDSTIIAVLQGLGKLEESDLEKEYPIVVFEAPMTIGYFLVHLATHLTYHLGQINYHRRMLDF